MTEDWLTRVERLLTVFAGDDAVMVAVRAPDLGGVHQLLTRLLTHCDTAACVMHWYQFWKQPEHNIIVYLPQDLGDRHFLQINRPIFNQRRWRVIVWASDERLACLREAAGDWFDWISHVVNRGAVDPRDVLASAGEPEDA